MYYDFYDKMKIRIESNVFNDYDIINELLYSLYNYVDDYIKNINFDDYITTYINCIEYYIEYNSITSDDKRIAIIFENGFHFWSIVNKFEQNEYNIKRGDIKKEIIKLNRWFIEKYPKYMYLIPMDKIGHDIIVDIVKVNPMLVKYFMRNITTDEYKKQYVLFFLKINVDTYKYLMDYIDELNLNDNELIMMYKENSILHDIIEYIS